MYVDENQAYRALIDEGILTEKTARGLRDFATIQDELGDHYEVSEVRGGKAGLKRIDTRGMTDSTDNLNALLMAIDTEMNGPIVDHRPGMSPEVQGPVQETFGNRRLRTAMEHNLSPGGASELAKPGLRAGAMAGMPDEQRMARAIGYAQKIGQGYDPLTGSRLTMGLDGGHIFPHHAYPNLSTSDFNINPENKYVNRAKGSREGEELISSLTNAFNKKFGPVTKPGRVPYSRMAGLWTVGRGFV